MRWQAGDTSLPARELNRFADAADAVARLPRIRQPGVGSMEPRTIVKNSSGATIERFQVLGLGDLIIDPASFEDGFLDSLMIDGDTPAQADHWGKFAIALEAIPAGEYGLAKISGLAHVKIDIKHESHEFADVNDTDATKLRSAGCGSARIVSRATGTGEKWAIVQLQARGVYRFSIEITGVAQTNAGKFKYAWREVIRLSDGTAPAVTGGLSGTTSAGYALNCREINHTGSGIVSGVDLDGDDYPAGYAPRPVNGGGTDNTHQANVVVDAELINGQVWFDSVLTHDGTCSA